VTFIFPLEEKLMGVSTDQFYRREALRKAKTTHRLPKINLSKQAVRLADRRRNSMGAYWG
jgi:hypothetical protein